MEGRVAASIPQQQWLLNISCLGMGALTNSSWVDNSTDPFRIGRRNYYGLHRFLQPFTVIEYWPQGISAGFCRRDLMKLSSRRTAGALLILQRGFALVCAENSTTRLAASQLASKSLAAQAKEAAATRYQIDEIRPHGAALVYQKKSHEAAGSAAGMYYMKCWICHNDYTRRAEPHPAPLPQRSGNLYQRPLCRQPL